MFNTDPILIADDDLDYIGSLQIDPSSKVVVAVNASEAVEKLSRSGALYSAIFINPTIKKPLGVPLVRMAMRHMPAVPVFLLSKDQRLPITPDELRQLNVRKVIRKPAQIPDLIKAGQDARGSLNPLASLDLSASDPNRVCLESDLDESHFTPILARQFACGGPSLFDLYVRLHSRRFVKILKAGDDFDPGRLSQYLEKGVEYFYLRRESQATYLRYCDELAATLVENPNLPDFLKVQATLNHGQEALSYLIRTGISDEGLEYAQAYVDRTLELIDMLKLTQHPKIQALLADATLFNHAVTATMIVALLLQPLKLQSDRTFNSFGLACMLHDIGLQGLSEAVLEEDESQMTSEELALFHAHPAIGARILAEIQGIDEVVVQGVLQHHERRNGFGFSQSFSTGSISPIAELVGIGCDYAQLLKRAVRHPGLDIQGILDKKVLPGFSAPLVDIFKKTFFK